MTLALALALAMAFTFTFARPSITTSKAKQQSSKAKTSPVHVHSHDIFSPRRANEGSSELVLCHRFVNPFLQTFWCSATAFVGGGCDGSAVWHTNGELPAGDIGVPVVKSKNQKKVLLFCCFVVFCCCCFVFVHFCQWACMHWVGIFNKIACSRKEEAGDIVSWESGCVLKA